MAINDDGNHLWLDLSTHCLVDLWENVSRAQVGVRIYAAWRDEVPVEAAEAFVHDDEPRARRGVATNTKISIHALQTLMMDEDKWVRRAVLFNANTTINMLTHLSKDPEETVRSAILDYGDVPTSVLRDLVKDPSPDIAERAGRTLALRLRESP